ncbi:MAG: hypothetical protein KME15_26430 [Drouetiella hepatica Uher 2000/2452]|jgi:hypothetical protein|uniref:HTH cro/C1-type domain-containing protein n=1 Tax=Drouetiella hepatica Uher 2000/2452 TaxID=904376 RepID=A0A951QI57_9CYAN|nr:hypothetical protein [Drouetiella hepatica Uher 2000/2452]
MSQNLSVINPNPVVSCNTSVTQATTRQQDFQSFLTALGYGFEDDIYIRLLPPKGFDTEHYRLFPALTYSKGETVLPKRMKFRMRGDRLFWITSKGERLQNQNAFDWLTKANQDGMAPYIVVNPGGHTESQIQGSRVLFWEDDKRSKAEQLERFDEYQENWGGGFAIETRSSIHCYFRHGEFHDPLDFSINQLRIIRQLDSDASIWDAPRLMRIPGFDHTSIVDGAIARTPVKIVRPWDGETARWFAIDDSLPQPTDEDIAKATGTHQRSHDSIPVGDEPCDPRNFIKLLPCYCSGSEWDSAQIPALGVTSQSGFKVNLSSGRYKVWSGTVSSWEALKAIAAYLEPIDSRITLQGIIDWLRGDDPSQDAEPVFDLSLLEGIEDHEETPGETVLGSFARRLEQFLRPNKRKQRQRVEPIATESIRVPYIVGQLLEYRYGLELPIFEIERPSQQRTFYSEAYAKGWGHILNGSQPGTGKSHEAGNLRAKDFEHVAESFASEQGDKPDSDLYPTDLYPADSDESKTPTLLYFSNQSRLPSTTTVEQNFSEVTIRHNGMVVDGDRKTPLGKDYLRIPKEGEVAATRSNCHRSAMFVAAASKGLDWASEGAKTNPICQGCPFDKQRDSSGRALCATSSGDGYGYRFERRQSFQAKELRLHPNSAPDLNSIEAIATWEEASQLLTPELRTGWKNDLEAQFGALEDSALTDIYEALAPFRKAFRAMLNEPKRYGYSKGEIVERLGAAPDCLDLDTLEQIKEAITPTAEATLINDDGIATDHLTTEIQSLRGKLDRREEKRSPKAFRLCELEADLKIAAARYGAEAEANGLRAEIADLRAEVSKLDYEVAEMGDRLKTLEDERAELKKIGARVNWQGRIDGEKELKNTPTQLLVEILGIWAGLQDGAMRINGSQIILTLPNRRLEQLTKGARMNIYLDATITPQVLAAKINVDVSDILHFVVKQEPVNNVQRFQIGGFGKCGRDRAASTDKRLKHLHQGILQDAAAKLGKPVDDIQLAIADYKGEKSEAHGAQIRHMSNSRGTNEIEGCQVLIVHGLPKPNMGAIADEYECLINKEFSFEQFYQDKADAEIIQLDQRPRARRYPDRQFLIYYITDEPLPFEAVQVKAGDLSWDAAPKGEKTSQSLLSALADFVGRGTKLTQQVLAAAAGVTQGYLSRWFADHGGWDWWKKIITNPYIASIGVGNNPLEKFEKLVQDEAWLAGTYISQAIAGFEDSQEGAIGVLDTVSEIIKTWGSRVWERIWVFIPIDARQKIIAALLLGAIDQPNWGHIRVKNPQN